MKTRRATSRRGAFGMISHITPVALTVFIALWYAPFIAGWLRVQGWSKGAALGMGFVLPCLWLLFGVGFASMLPVRFAKLRDALGWIIYGLPVIGMIGSLFWVVARTIWHLAH